MYGQGVSCSFGHVELQLGYTVCTVVSDKNLQKVLVICLLLPKVIKIPQPNLSDLKSVSIAL